MPGYSLACHILQLTWHGTHGTHAMGAFLLRLRRFRATTWRAVQVWSLACLTWNAEKHQKDQKKMVNGCSSLPKKRGSRSTDLYESLSLCHHMSSSPLAWLLPMSSMRIKLPAAHGDFWAPTWARHWHPRSQLRTWRNESGNTQAFIFCLCTIPILSHSLHFSIFQTKKQCFYRCYPCLHPDTSWYIMIHLNYPNLSKL